LEVSIIRLEVAAAYSNGGDVIYNQGKLEEAFEQFRRVLEIIQEEKALNIVTLNVATSYSNTWSVLYKQGKPEEAFAN
jgi:tetratricopeptide (TPR) repeat protein